MFAISVARLVPLLLADFLLGDGATSDDLCVHAAMAHIGNTVYPAAATPSRADAALLRADAAGEPICTTCSSAAHRSVSAAVSTVLRVGYPPEASAESVQPSCISAKSSPSASLSPAESEQTRCAAEHADLPALLIICLSPELLSSPSHEKQCRQRLQQQEQSGRQFEHTNAQRELEEKQSRKGGVEALEEQPKEQLATCTRISVAAGSRVCLPADSPGYIFLAEQFLPSLGLPMSFDDGNTMRQEESIDASLENGVPAVTSAHVQQRESSSKGVVDQQGELSEQHQKEDHHKQTHYRLRLVQPPRSCQDPPQPRLRRLPAACLLRTKYYEAPLRLLYQFFEPVRYDVEVCAPDASGCAARGEFSQSQYSNSGAPLHLSAPPEAVLLLCSSLADLYRAHELMGTATQQSSVFYRGRGSSVSSTHEASAAEAAAANGDTLPLPHLLRHSPYVVVRGDLQEADPRTGAGAAPGQAAAAAVGTGAASGGEAREVIPARNEKPDESCTFPERAHGVLETAEEGETTGENWLFSVPVKLLVCFDAGEKETEASGGRETSTTRTSSVFSQPNASCEDCDDPSVILFFENSCFLEKVSLSLPTRSLWDGAAPAHNAVAASSAPLAAKRSAQTPAGTTAADETVPAAQSREIGAATGKTRSCKAPSWCSVRPLLGATMPLLQNKGMGNSSMPALQRLVEALHCHMWPNMRLIKNNNKGGRTGKVVAPTTERQCEHRSIHLHSSSNGSNRGTANHSNISKTDESATHECNDAEATAGPESIDAEHGMKVRDKEEAVLADVTIENVAAAARTVTTTAADGYAITGTATITEPFTSTGGGPAVASETTEGAAPTSARDGIAAASRNNRERAAENAKRIDTRKTREEVPLQTWESLARTVREMRLEAHRLPQAERTAKAEALTLQLAQALGVSDDEEDDG